MAKSGFPRPTDMALTLFNSAFTLTNTPNPSNKDIMMVLNFEVQGLEALAIGLRATYIKLEEIEGAIKQLKLGLRAGP